MAALTDMAGLQADNRRLAVIATNKTVNELLPMNSCWNMNFDAIRNIDLNSLEKFHLNFTLMASSMQISMSLSVALRKYLKKCRFHCNRMEIYSIGFNWNANALKFLVQYISLNLIKKSQRLVTNRGIQFDRIRLNNANRGNSLTSVNNKIYGSV